MSGFLSSITGLFRGSETPEELVQKALKFTVEDMSLHMIRPSQEINKMECQIIEAYCYFRVIDGFLYLTVENANYDESQDQEKYQDLYLQKGLKFKPYKAEEVQQGWEVHYEGTPEGDSFYTVEASDYVKPEKVKLFDELLDLLT